MASPKRNKKTGEIDLSQGCWIALGATLGPQVVAWMNQNNIVSHNDAIQLLCRLGLSSAPDLAVYTHYRKRAYDAHRMWMIQRTYDFLNSMLKEQQEEEKTLAYLKAQQGK